MRVLSQTDVQKALSMPSAIAMVRDAFAQLSTHQATVPVRVPIDIKQHDGITLFMPAHLHASDALAVKIVSVHNQNPAKNLPLIHALVVLIDPNTGKPLAAMDGGYLTAMRTGAASGVATDLLARREARVAAIFGAGVQGRTQLRGIAAVRKLERVHVYDAIPGKAEEFVREVKGSKRTEGTEASLDLRAAASAREAVRDADVICTATTSKQAVFDYRDVKRGAHINAVGAYTPVMQEIPPELARASKIVVDHLPSALAEAGDLIIAMKAGFITEANIYAELGEIAAGKKPGRTNDDEITFFKSVGNAVQDAAVAQAVYQTALEKNFGTEIEL